MPVYPLRPTKVNLKKERRGSFFGYRPYISEYIYSLGGIGNNNVVEIAFDNRNHQRNYYEMSGGRSE